MARRLFLALALALAAPGVGLAQDQRVAAPAESARSEIERILDADNLSATQPSPREVYEVIAGIEQNRAPDDFWSAYQLHVRAWGRFAAAVEQAQRQQGGSGFPPNLEELAAAERAIETTFNEVERIALRYGARLPTPPVDPRTIA